MKTYGRVTLHDDRWVIDCEPHVLIRLKRHFGKIGKQPGKAVVSHNDENARELEWFLVRYPMEVDPADELTARANAHRETMERVQSVLFGEYLPPSLNELAVPAREYQKLAAALVLTNRGLLVADDVGLGKAQPLTAGVLTPRGWALMGDLAVGDSVIDPDGGVATVMGIYPQGDREVFRVTTADGASTECCDEHLWTVKTPNDRVRGGERTLPLSEIRKRLHEVRGNGQRLSHFFLPLTKPAEFAATLDLPVPPYLLGVLLGDGRFKDRSVSLSSADGEILDRVRDLLPAFCSLVQERGSSCDWRISSSAKGGTRNSLVSKLRSLQLLGVHSPEKFIPSAYLRASIADRLELLRGLMDTDGTVAADGTAATFTTTSPQLAGDVIELVGGLGGFASSWSRITLYTHGGEKRQGRRSYTLNIRIPVNPFHLERKATRWSAPLLARAIRSVESIGVQPVQCIAVSSRRHLYVTDGHIVTHNTVTAITTFTDPRTLPVLVVTLTHLPRQWEAMCNRFAPQLRVHIIKGTTPYDVGERFTKEAKRRKLYVHGSETILQGGFPDVTLINYHKLSGWADALAGVVKHVVFDEIQELRHSSSFKFSAAQQIAQACEFRMGLSATPIYNYGGEMFNVLDTLHPGKLGSRAEFLREWCGGYDSPGYGNPDDKAKIKNPKAFGVYTRDEGLMIRRTREEVKRELPPVENVMHLIDSDMAALERVGSAAAELARIIVARNETFRGQIMRASEELSNLLRQATGVAKAPFVADFVRLLVEQGEPVLLYGWHREVYGIWLDRLSDLNPVMYYVVEWKELRARDYGAPTSRKRLFILARRDGKPIAWPPASHATPTDSRVTAGKLLPFRTTAQCIDFFKPDGSPNFGKSIFDRKKPHADPTNRRVAQGVVRYVLNRRPFIVNLTHGGRLESVDEPASTITSAHRGEKAIVTPVLMSNNSNNAPGHVEEPLGTITTGNRHFVVSPALIQTGYGEREGPAPRVLDIQAPLGTAPAQGQKHALVGAFLAKHNDGNASFGIPLDRPADTITTKDHHALVSASLIQQNYGSSQWQSPEEPINTLTQSNHHAVVSAGLAKLRGTSSTADIEDPSPTITGQGQHLGLITAQIAEYYGTDQRADIEAPSPTVTTKDRFALVSEELRPDEGDRAREGLLSRCRRVAKFLKEYVPGLHFPDGIVRVEIDGITFVIVDLFMRMLSPRELARCQGFDDDYVLFGTITQQVGGIGNSVPPAFTEAIGRANTSDDDDFEEVAA